MSNNDSPNAKTQSEPLQEIAPGVFTFRGLGIGRAYLIQDEESLSLIDAGWAPLTPSLMRQVVRAGFDLQAIDRILITHAHPDHAGNLPALVSKTGAQVYSSEMDRPALEGRAPLESGPLRFKLHLPRARVDEVLKEGDRLTVLGGLRVIETPGHTSGHLAYYAEERRVLFCGDVLIRFPALRLPFAMFTTDMEEDIRSARRIAELDADVVCFGHGVPFVGDAGKKIREFVRSIG